MATIISDAVKKLNIGENMPHIERVGIPVNLATMWDYIGQIGRCLCPNFAIDAINGEVYENIARWVLGLPFECMNPVTKKKIAGRPERGLFITGATGTGKTVAMQVAWNLAKLYGATINIGRTSYLLQWTNCRAEDVCDEYGRSGESQLLRRHPVLCVNDLGTEPRETLYMGNRVEVMRQVIERWGDRRDRMLLVTSNLPLYYQPTNEREEARDTIRKHYGARAESRLIEMCNYFYMDGADRRYEIEPPIF